MSQQQTAKPSLQGVRIKARKGTVKAQAKHEPAVFRDQLYKHFETVPPGDFEAFTNKLIQAGSTLEFLKYADPLFEILFVGGLLQPGGSYVDDGSPLCSWAIVNAKDRSVEHLKKYIDVQNKLIRRHKYLQKPLEESALPTLLQYMNRWPVDQKDKMATAIGIMLSQGLATAACLQSLTKDHLIKNDVASGVIAIVFSTCLAENGTIDHLANILKKGGIKDLSLFFPPNKREDKAIDEFFRNEGLVQVADWWTKKKYGILKEGLVKTINEHLQNGDFNVDDVVNAIKQEQQTLPEVELIQCIWTGLTMSIEWSARPDQHKGLILKEVTRFTKILEPFCNGPKTEVALINAVQVYCYEYTKVMDSFPQILKILYNEDCITNVAIIYWFQKGANKQGRQHFLEATATLVKEQDEDEDEDESEGE